MRSPQQQLHRSFVGHAEMELIPSPWSRTLEELIDNVRATLQIVAPYITRAGTNLILDRMRTSARRPLLTMQLVTDLNPLSVCQGSCDPEAILRLMDHFNVPHVIHLPRVHAKILVADRAMAIIGSANLTDGGLYENYEYNVKINSPTVVRKIAADVAEYASLGATIPPDLLISYCEAANSLRKTFQRRQRIASTSLVKEFNARTRSAQDLLLRARVSGSVTGIFKKTILFLLRAGPVRTVDLHPQIKRMHPDLCDDSVDRIIDGERYGKKWKHLVRTAQQMLKRDGLIEFDDKFWRLSNAPSG